MAFPFPVKSWQNAPSTATKINAAALQDMEQRLSDFAALLRFGHRPEMEGAVGNGTADDTTAILNTLATGRPFVGSPGKVYICRKQLNATQAGMVFFGNGSAIKRPPQIVTTTTTTITSGVTQTITLASATGLQIGDQIVPEQGGNFDFTARTISNIVGNVVTVSAPFVIQTPAGGAVASLSGTINVRTAFNQVNVAAKNVRFVDLEFDGNKVNWSWGRWQHSAAIIGDTATEKNMMVAHCHIHDQYGDGVDPGGPGAVVFGNWIENCAGRGVVFSGIVGAPTNIGNRCIGNHVLTCNTDTATGGFDGTASIDFSQGGPNTLIEGNYVDGGVDGTSSSGTQNAGVKVIDNEYRNLTGRAVDINWANASVLAGSITVRDNEFDTCTLGGVRVKIDSTTLTVVGRRVKIKDNEFRAVLGEVIEVGCPTGGKSISEPKIVDNVIYGSSGAGSQTRLIHLYRALNGVIRDNTCLGGQTAIYVDGAATDTKVRKNFCKGQYTKGIDVQVAGVSTRYNTVLSDSTRDAANWQGINAEAGDLIDNEVDGQAGGLRCMRANGSQQVVRGNKLIQGAAGIGTLLLGAGSAGATVTQNNMDAMYTDSGSGNRKFGNLVSASGQVSGLATLVAGTVTVNTAEIQTGDRVILIRQAAGGTTGTITLGTIVAGTSFVISSSSGTDTSTVFWRIEH